MAAKKNKTRADKAVEREQRSQKTSGAASKTAAGKKTEKPRTKTKVRTEYERTVVSPGAVAAAAIVVLAVVLAVCVNPDGALLKALHSVLFGLFGQAGVYISVYSWLLIIWIHLMPQNKKLKQQGTGAVLFAIFCGAIYHLAVEGSAIHTADSAANVIMRLYEEGAAELSGGVVCGGLAALLQWLCGKTVAYMILICAAVVSLFASMQITAASLIKAYRSRPKVEEYEQDEDYIEPAAVVVNTVAQKKIDAQQKKKIANALKAEQEQAAQKEERARELALADRAQTSAHGGNIQQPVKKKTAAVQKSEIPVEKKAEVSQPVSTQVDPRRRRNIMSVWKEENEITPEAEPAEVICDRTPTEAIQMVAQMRMQHDAVQVKPDAPEISEPAAAEADTMSAAEQPVKNAPSKPAASKRTGKTPEVSEKDKNEAAEQIGREISKAQSAEQPGYVYPPIDLLKLPASASGDGTDEVRHNSQRLNDTLASFRIDAHITDVTRGPSVTRYEVELAKGVRLNKLTGCADDIALSLGTSGVRIAAIPGKISIVGIEVPNQNVTTVSLREVIDSENFRKAKSKSSFSVGKVIAGNCIVGNISKLPHMLIAGTTGSGKSVCMNSIIISLLYKSSPEDVKLIMVDPKMVELGIYNGIPHLLIPVVTDPKKAAGSLQWAVTEMLRRYKAMSEAGVRDLESYNEIVEQDDKTKKLPQIVVIIDELADLMMVAAKEVEDSICRIAQMGRASGIHLVIATQRPSADVITGLMKANIPSRIAFAVASAMESRIILDTQGAEKLVGRGDMLYAPIGSGKPLRVQGCFVTDAEVERVAEFVKSHSQTEYDRQIQEEVDRNAQKADKAKPAAPETDAGSDDSDFDEMLPAAVDVILETKQCSVSMLQRRLKLGYARAARIVDQMEELGYVGPFQGSKPRDILITQEAWAAKKNGEAAAAEGADVSEAE